MPFEAHINNEFVGASGVRGYRSELKRSLKQHQTSKAEKHKVVPPLIDQYSKFQDKFEIEYPFCQPHVPLHPELKQNVNGEILVQMTHLGDQRKHPIRSKTSKDDEVVKYMSNLPGYLWRMDRGEKHWEKALNFGVLDWERLEKWKHMRLPERNSMNASFTSNASSGFTTFGSSIRSGSVCSEILALQNKQKSSLGSDPDSSHVEGLSNGIKPYRGKVMDVQDHEPGHQSSDMKQKLCRTSKTLGDNNSATMVEKEKRKDLDQMITSGTGTSSSKSTNYDATHGSKKKVSSRNGETKRRVEELQDLNFKFSSPLCPNKPQNIVLLLPRDLPRKSCSEQLLSEPRPKMDKNVTNVSMKSFSDAFFPRKGHHTELHFEVSHSCPLHCRADTNALGLELPSGACKIQENKSKAKVSNPTLSEATKRLDRELSDMTAAEGRAQSPNCRFGIGLGRMGRSFSLKESSAVPQLISSPDDAQSEKAHAHSQNRSSPLRRLLDPVLKLKSANTHSADTGPLERNLNRITSKQNDATASESVLYGKQGKSVVHALLQFTVKNGLPLFKFIVDNNNSDILATTVKKLTQSGKDYSSWIYTFYSVHEMNKNNKKSAGLTNQGSKGKSCGYAYNVVGQMKVSGSKDQTLANQSVLFGFDANQEVSVCAPKELAAIVTNKKSTSCNGEESDKHRGLTKKGLTQCKRIPEDKSFCASEDDSRNHTTVILPDGIHGLPNEGVPSPLIDRWKSGGSCDCGGWDIGCKLRVLTSYNAGNMVLGLSKACPTTGCFDFFIQGGVGDNRPMFSLVPLKSEIYSVKFNASISLLQAFSICVAVISSEKSSDISGTSHPSEAGQFEPAGLHRTSPAIILGQSPVRYVPYPPYSPVGRA